MVIAQPKAPDLTDHDINYIRRWDVSASQFLEKGRELICDDLPKDSTQWQPILPNAMRLDQPYPQIWWNGEQLAAFKTKTAMYGLKPLSNQQKNK
jgi:hypothetical protein